MHRNIKFFRFNRMWAQISMFAMLVPSSWTIKKEQLPSMSSRLQQHIHYLIFFNNLFIYNLLNVRWKSPRVYFWLTQRNVFFQRIRTAASSIFSKTSLQILSNRIQRFRKIQKSYSKLVFFKTMRLVLTEQ